LTIIFIFLKASLRRAMVAAVRRGQSLRAVAAQFAVSVSVAAYWVNRARGKRLDRVQWTDRSHAPLHPRRTRPAMEDLVSTARRTLEGSDLGAIGACAIRLALLNQGAPKVPSVRTINRILARSTSVRRRGYCRRGLRRRKPPPPRGWYLPDLAAGRAELDNFDIVEALAVAGGPAMQALNAVSLHGGLTESWPVPAPVTAKFTVKALTAHWRALGLPRYAQFDNDPVFQGTHSSAVALGRVIRLCLSLGVTPVFVPPGEIGFQAMIEGYNGWWLAKVWARFAHGEIESLQDRSRRYVAATRQRRADRINAAPRRRPFPKVWRLDLQAPPRGRIVYLRRTNAKGELDLFGRNWRLFENGPRRLVRVELDLTQEQIRFFSLSRSDPPCQPLLMEAHFQLPVMRFRDRSKYASTTMPP
jgi:hypothetical protein